MENNYINQLIDNITKLLGAAQIFLDNYPDLTTAQPEEVYTATLVSTLQSNLQAYQTSLKTNQGDS